MSVNIIVNGKFGRTIKKNTLLEDTEQIKKDLQNERRIYRLQQVREESNIISKKIRENVAEEKERQLKKLTDIKQQELNCWRHNAFIQKHQDMSSGVFQVGAAHRAAKAENERIGRKKVQSADKLENEHQFRCFNVQQKKNINCNRRNTMYKNEKPEKESEKNANLKITTANECDLEKNSVTKRKPNRCCRENIKCCCELSIDSETSDTMTTTSSFHLESDSGRNKLCKTPAVVLDVEIESEDSIVVDTNGTIEIKDNHTETNQQFSRVISESSGNDKTCSQKKQSKKLEKKHPPKRTSKPHFTQVSDLVRRSVQSQLQLKEDNGKFGVSKDTEQLNGQCSSKCQPINSSKGLYNKTKAQITSKLKNSAVKFSKTKKKVSTITSATKRIPPPPPTALHSSGRSNSKISNEESRPADSAIESSKLIEITKITKCTDENVLPTQTTQANLGKSFKTVNSECRSQVSDLGDNCERVKFYDYNNKFHKDYQSSVKTVKENINDRTFLSAMDHAEIENHLQKTREKEIENLRKISDERGQIAIEREKVRRDCADLTEKLEQLLYQRPTLVPNDSTHRFVDLAAKRDAKMNHILEKIILSPAVVTCPEVLKGNQSKVFLNVNSRRRIHDSLNVGDRLKKAEDSVTVSSDSCSSILLNYVDNQSKQLHSDLIETKKNTEKAESLKKLLNRIEYIRATLKNELASGTTIIGSETVQNTIRKIQQDREKILQNETPDRNLDKKKEPTTLSEDINGTHNNNKGMPLEILIKVTSDGQVKKCITKRKATRETALKDVEKPIEEPSKNNMENVTIVDSFQDIETMVDSAAQQNSYDTNSTSYRSLPPVLGRNDENFGNNLKPENVVKTASSTKKIEPVVAQYIQRLLGMSRLAIQELDISSSDIVTPSSSIINNSKNISKEQTIDESLIKSNSMQRIEHFIEDNRSFVNDLENTLKSHTKESLENNMLNFNQLWTKRLEKTKVQKESVQNGRTTEILHAQKTVSLKNKESPLSKNRKDKTVTNMISSTDNEATNGNKSQNNKGVSEGKFVVECSDTQNQLERYAKLTENCTSRIAELTDLIHKVREEKQKLLEVTLTSASDTGRNSTEYFELPSSKTTEYRSKIVSENYFERNTGPFHLKPNPLQKNKITGISCDSGISVSRPLTSQGQVQDLENVSTASSARSSFNPQHKEKTQSSDKSGITSQRNVKDLVHDLSTIAEVDTPAPSRINATSTVKNITKPNVSKHFKLIPFPSFEQYAKELRVDLTQIDPEQSFTLQNEFNELITSINEKVQKPVNYQEFPSISAYLHNLTSTFLSLEIGNPSDSNSPRTVNELIQYLRIANVNARGFPSQREYMQQCMGCKDNADDDVTISSDDIPKTNKLKNESESTTTDSFNVEAELRKRKILRSAFRRANASNSEYVASSTQRESAAFFTDVLPSESGIDKLPSSQCNTESTKAEKEANRLKQNSQRSKSNNCEKTTERCSRKIEKRMDLMCSGSKSNNESDNFGQTLNLREFLRKELLKHVNQSGSTSSDDSLKSNFLQSVIDSSSTRQANNVFSHTDRQKTSTPVVSSNLSKSEDYSRSTTDQLFSGESCISSVHFHEAKLQPGKQNYKSKNNSDENK